MKEFTSAVEDVVQEDEREAKIVALMAEKSISREDAESQIDHPGFVEFMLDGRPMRAYPPNEGQLVFLMATMGRGQSKQSRFASIVNIMLESLRPDDRDYMEGRLLAGDTKDRLPVKKVEEIFEFLATEWFATPTLPPSDSASSSQSDGANSTPPTTPSPEV